MQWRFRTSDLVIHGFQTLWLLSTVITTFLIKTYTPTHTQNRSKYFIKKHLTLTKTILHSYILMFQLHSPLCKMTPGVPNFPLVNHNPLGVHDTQKTQNKLRLIIKYYPCNKYVFHMPPKEDIWTPENKSILRDAHFENLFNTLNLAFCKTGRVKVILIPSSTFIRLCML